MIRNRHRIATIGRWLAAALIVLWLLPGLSSAVRCCGFGRSVAGAASPITLRGAFADSLETHSALCHCLDCPGGKLCCCTHGQTPTDHAILRSVCDREAPADSPAALPDAVLPAAPLSLILVMGVPDCGAPSAAVALPAGQSLVPSSPPPRLS